MREASEPSPEPYELFTSRACNLATFSGSAFEVDWLSTAATNPRLARR
jgi:hypothetical protein